MSVISQKNKKYHQIVVTDVTYKKLRDLGKTSDSFNDVVSWLLEKSGVDKTK